MLFVQVTKDNLPVALYDIPRQTIGNAYFTALRIINDRYDSFAKQRAAKNIKRAAGNTNLSDFILNSLDKQGYCIIDIKYPGYVISIVQSKEYNKKNK